MPDTTKQATARSQLDKFKEAAKQAETDNSEERFDRSLKRVAAAVPPKPEPKRQ